MLSVYKREFINLVLSKGVLKFGEFTLKSGRVSPYFFNIGDISSGDSISRIGRCYADLIQRSFSGADFLFGPAYKGIPLVVATSVALLKYYDTDISYAFNRKERKDHGEGGEIIGQSPSGNVLILDDVISAGTSIREACEICKRSGANPVGVVVSIDRQETGLSNLSAIEELEEELNIQIFSLVSLDDIIQYLEQNGNFQKELSSIQRYQGKYGIGSR